MAGSSWSPGGRGKIPPPFAQREGEWDSLGWCAPHPAPFTAVRRIADLQPDGGVPAFLGWIASMGGEIDEIAAKADGTVTFRGALPPAALAEARRDAAARGVAFDAEQLRAMQSKPMTPWAVVGNVLLVALVTLAMLAAIPLLLLAVILWIG